MKKIYGLLISLICLVFSVSAFAWEAPSPPENGWYVLDTSQTLNAEQLKTLNTKIDTFSKNTKNEIAVLLIDNFGDSNIEDVAYQTFNKWGVGKKGLDNGVLLVVSKGNRKIRIETGKGVGGKLTDLQASDIIKSMKPFLKKGSENWFGALDIAVNNIAIKLDSHKEAGSVPVVQDNSTTSNAEFPFAGMFVSMIVFASGLIAWLMYSSEKRSSKKMYSAFDSYPSYNSTKSKTYTTPAYNNFSSSVHSVNKQPNNVALGGMHNSTNSQYTGPVIVQPYSYIPPLITHSQPTHSPPSESSYKRNSSSDDSSSSYSSYSSDSGGGFDGGSSGGGGASGDF